MNIQQMFSTTGGILYYGGIAGIVLSVLLLLLFKPSFSFQRKRLKKKIEEEFDK